MQAKPTTIFISHASEDKHDFVRPLAHALKSRGLRVWYDEFSLKLGDSLRRSIDKGLAECSAGVVVLSPSFFAKEWPQRELDALYSAEITGRSRILPVWHRVDSAYIARHSPLLVDRRAALSSNGVENVAKAIAAEFPAEALFTGEELASNLERFSRAKGLSADALAAGCRYRFLLLNAWREEYCEIADRAFAQLAEANADELPAEVDRWLGEEQDRLRHCYGIPETAYLTADEPVAHDYLGSFLETVDLWARGGLSIQESSELIADLDREELDEYFVLLGLPNFSFSSRQRELLERALVMVGAALADRYESVLGVCTELRHADSAT